MSISDSQKSVIQLKTAIQKTVSASPFYQKKIALSDSFKFETFADLQQLPTTSKQDIQEHNWEFLCIPKSEIAEMTSSSGTLGQPVTVALSKNDLDRLAKNESHSFDLMQLTNEDTIQLMLTLDKQFMAGMAYYSGAVRFGATVVRTGSGLPAMQWDTIFRLQSTVLVAVPSFLLRMLQYAIDHKIEYKKSSVKKILCIGESIRTAEHTDSLLLQKLKKLWPIAYYNTYASTEMQTAFTECEMGGGGHVNEELMAVEILNDAGEQLRHGEVGEVTITHIGVEAMPLIRYRTGDLSFLMTEKCACGRSAWRLPILGRKQHMIKYKGTTIYPPAIYELLQSQDFISEFAIEVSLSELGLDKIKLHLQSEKSKAEASKILMSLCQSKLRVVPEFQFHEKTEIEKLIYPEGTRKPQRFIDKR